MLRMEKNKRIGQREIGLLCDTPPLLGLSLMRSRPAEGGRGETQRALNGSTIRLSQFHVHPKAAATAAATRARTRKTERTKGGERGRVFVGGRLPARPAEKEEEEETNHQGRKAVGEGTCREEGEREREMIIQASTSLLEADIIDTN